MELNDHTTPLQMPLFFSRILSPHSASCIIRFQTYSTEPWRSLSQRNSLPNGTSAHLPQPPRSRAKLIQALPPSFPTKSFFLSMSRGDALEALQHISQMEKAKGSLPNDSIASFFNALGLLL